MTDPATQLLSLARMSLDNVWRMAGSAGAITIISTWGQDIRPLTRLTEWLHAGEVPTAWVEETIGWIGRHSDLVEALPGCSSSWE